MNFADEVLNRIFQTQIDMHLKKINAFGSTVGVAMRNAVQASI
jgi:hypothetical protein